MDNNSTIEICGHINTITFVNADNGYTIAKFDADGHSSLVTIVGILSTVNTAQILKLKGQWNAHPKYGQQFVVSSCITAMPVTIKGIEKYLSSDIIGLSASLAKKIVERFGLDTIDIIENSIDKLFVINGMSIKRIAYLKKIWSEQRDNRDAMIFLQENGVNISSANKIVNLYKDKTIETVKENPYRLASDIFGIGFVTADRIAESLNVEKNSVFRAEAGILYVLNQLFNNGHVYYPFDLLIPQAKKILDIDDAFIISALTSIAASKNVVIEEINNEKAVYLTWVYNAERAVSNNLKRLIRDAKVERDFDQEHTLQWVQRELDIEFAKRQAEAVIEALKNKVMIITGGPGTGKTTIIQAIIKAHLQSGSNVALAAPTGRAAKRMTEAAGYNAKTIHRLLEVNYESGGFKFKRNKDNPLESNVIVIDEASMIDTILMAQLLEAIPTNAALILVGDIDQLPSVGPGNVFRDIIDSHLVKVVKLDEIFRQSKDSLIIQNAHRVNKGEFPIVTFDKERPQDFYFFEIEEPKDIVERIILLCKDEIPQKFGLNPIIDIVVLTPMQKGIIGVGNLNIELQAALNPSNEDFLCGQRTFRKGDKVMQIVNNYDKDIYNGDIGRINNIKAVTREIIVDYDNHFVTYNYNSIDELALAYALSIHKSQGSEFPVVIIPIHTTHHIMLQRNLLYTGVTRGKRLVILIGSKKALSIAVKNNTPMKRFSSLDWRLKNLTNEKGF